MTFNKASNPNGPVVSVVVPVPLRQHFDFLLPEDSLFQDPEAKVNAVIGARVKVSFGSRQLIGVIANIKQDSDYPLEKLKPIIEIIDEKSIFESSLLDTLEWISRYYLSPIGEVFEAAMPVALRQGASVMPSPITVWRLTDYARSANPDELKRAPLQLAIIKKFMHNSLVYSNEFKQAFSGWRQAVNALVKKGWLEELVDLPKLSPTKR